MIDDTTLVEIRHDMMKFAHLQLRDEMLAEDVVQEALAAALTSAKEFAGRSALKTWVFAILRNKIIDQIRLQSRTTNISSLSQDEESMDEAFDTLFKTNAHWSPAGRPSAAVDGRRIRERVPLVPRARFSYGKCQRLKDRPQLSIHADRLRRDGIDDGADR